MDCKEFNMQKFTMWIFPVTFFKYLLNHFNFLFLGTVCEGKATALFCRKNEYFNILNVTFGRTQNTGVRDCDTTTTIDKPCIVSGMTEVVYNCHDKGFCIVKAIPGKYGNPCAVGVTKYLNITYRCEKKGNHQKSPLVGVLIKSCWKCAANLQDNTSADARFQESCFATLLKSHFGMAVLLQIFCISL